MSIHLTHGWPFSGSSIVPATAARPFSQLSRRKCCIQSPYCRTQSHEEKTTSSTIGTGASHSLGLAIELHWRAKQLTQPISNANVNWPVGRRRSLQYRPTCIRNLSSQADGDSAKERVTYNVTRKELRRLVGESDGVGTRQQSSRLTSDLQTWGWKNDIQEATHVVDIGNWSKDTERCVRELSMAMRDMDTPHSRLWEIYQSLPEPRALHLPREILMQLLYRLQHVEHKSTRSMLRFLAFTSDMKKSGLDIPLHAWNSAISFAGRCLKTISANEVESALRVWREMEQVAQVFSNNVTFNILFDVATKARKFVLADMILSEMASRKLEYSRYFRTGLIYYYGLRRDGDNVRKAYSELVDAGEIVDTAVLNCVIGALIDCGEIGAADLIFERAKQVHAAKSNPNLPPSDWRMRRRLGKRLDDAVRRLREADEQDESEESEAARHVAQIRETTSLAPDLITYKLFIYHYAVVLGDIDRTAQLVDEMEQYGIAVHGSVFRFIFQAFVAHGGVLYTQWTRKRLENTWLAFLEALDAQVSREEENPVEEMPKGPDPAVETSPSKQQEAPFFDKNDDIQRRFPSKPKDEKVPADGIEHAPGKSPNEVVRIEDLDDPNSHITSQDESVDILRPDDLVMQTNQTKNVYIARAMAQLVGLAFAKCATLGRTAEVWAEIRRRWVPDVLDDVAEIESEIAAEFPGKESLFMDVVERELQKTRIW